MKTRPPDEPNNPVNPNKPITQSETETTTNTTYTVATWNACKRPTRTFETACNHLANDLGKDTIILLQEAKNWNRMHLQQLKRHVYYTDAETETGILVPNKIEENVTRHVIYPEWSAIHIDEYAFVTIHANDINSFKDDNRYDVSK